MAHNDPKSIAADRENPSEHAAPLVPSSRKLTTLRRAAASCLACPLGPPATQTVFGEGAENARLFLIGEQPGDVEDRRGQVFVGPAGKMLDRALAAARIARDEVYLTNAVKHFHFRPTGKKRLHQRPEWKHMEACRPWLRAELASVQPRVVVCLGAVAAQSLMGRRFTVLKNRGRALASPWADVMVITYHPSAILRMPTQEARDAAFALLSADLALALRLSRAGAKAAFAEAAKAAPPASDTKSTNARGDLDQRDGEETARQRDVREAPGAHPQPIRRARRRGEGRGSEKRRAARDGENPKGGSESGKRKGPRRAGAGGQ